MRRRPLLSLTLGATASALAGCAWFGNVPLDARSVDVAPVYRSGDVPGTAEGQVALGRLELAAGRIEAAMGRFRNAIAADARHADAYNGLGVALGMQERFEEAVQVFRAGLARDPDSARLHNNLGYALLRAGQTEAAARSLGRALELDATSERTTANLQLLAQAQAGSAAAPVIATPLPLPAAVAMAPQPSVAAPAPQIVTPTTHTSQTMPLTGVTLPLTAATTPQVVATTPQVVATTPQVVATTPQTIATTPQVVATTPLTAAAYEVVVNRPGAATLERVAPGVFEYRAQAPRAAVAVDQTARSPEPAARPAVRVEAAMTRESAASSPSVAQAAAAQRVDRPAARTAAAPSLVADVEVSNGVGIPGVAGLAAQRLTRLGAGVVRISNNRSWIVRQSQVLYRPGHEAAARALGKSLPLEVRLVESDALATGVNLRLLIGQDIATAPGLGFLRGKPLAAPLAATQESAPWAVHSAASGAGWIIGRHSRG